MATKRNNGLPLQLNPNLSTDLKKRVDNMNQDVQNVKQNSNKPSDTTMKQGTNPQPKPAKKLNAPNMNPGKNNYVDPGLLKPKKNVAVPLKPSNSAQRIENAIKAPKKSNVDVKGVAAVKDKMTKKPAKKESSAKKEIKKAFDAVAVMKERRAKAMANRDPKKNPNNVNLRGIVKTQKKGRKG